MMNIAQVFIRLAGASCIVAPLLMLTADVLQFTGQMFEFTLVLWLSFVFFVPAIFGLTYLAAKDAGWPAILGGASAFFGAVAGASMQVLFRVYAVLAETGATEVIEQLRSTFKLIATTQMIGLFYPIGLLTLAACLFWKRTIAPLYVFALVAGTILFPVGRIFILLWASIASDVLLVVAFGFIGQRLLSISKSGS